MPKTMLRSCAAAAFLLLAAPVHAAPALWQIDDADSILYLFGTAHVTRPGNVWQTPRLKAAITASKTIWLEIAPPDDKSAIAALTQKLGIDRETPLDTRLTPQQNRTLATVAAHYGLPLAQLMPMRPWLAGMMIARMPVLKTGLDPRAGADLVIAAMARAAGGDIRGLESAEEQIRLIADLPMQQQIAFLDAALASAAEGPDGVLSTIDAWQRGDLRALSRRVDARLRRQAPEVHDRLVVSRNRAFADRIKALLATPGQQMIVIGVGHFVGSDSIQNLLARAGIKVTRIG